MSVNVLVCTWYCTGTGNMNNGDHRAAPCILLYCMFVSCVCAGCVLMERPGSSVVCGWAWGVNGPRPDACVRTLARVVSVGPGKAT